MNAETIDAYCDTGAKTYPVLRASDCEQVLEIGQGFRGKEGFYLVGTVLASTYMSRVYNGESSNGEKIVIKQFLRNQLSNAFEREKYASSALKHPNIIPVEESITERGNRLAVLPFVEGRTLEEVIRQNPRMARDQECAAPIVAALCDTVDYIHQHGFAHRDLKPANIMLTVSDEGEIIPLLFDFGIAWHPYLAGYERSGRNGMMIKGTPEYLAPEYMAPENFQTAAKYKTADIYSLAVVFYEFLTGSFLMDGIRTADIRDAHLYGMPALEIGATPFLTEEEKKVLRKGMDPDPAKRYQTAEEMKLAYLEAVEVK